MIYCNNCWNDDRLLRIVHEDAGHVWHKCESCGKMIQSRQQTKSGMLWKKLDGNVWLQRECVECSGEIVF